MKRQFSLAGSLIVWLWAFLALTAGADAQALYQQHLDPYPIKITLPVKIGDKTYSFTLATLTYFTQFDTSLRGLLGEPKKTQQLRGSLGDGSVGVEFFDAPALKLGEWEIPSQPAGIIDMAGLNSMGLTHFQGWIGFEALADHTLILDFDRETLEIFDSPRRIPLNMERMDLGRSGSSGAVIAAFVEELDGQRVELGIEIGADGFIGLAHDVFEKLVASGMIQRTRTGGFDQSPFGKSTDVEWGVFTRGQIMGVNLEGKPVHGHGQASILGLDFIVNFNLVFDFKAGKLYYRWRNAEPPLALRSMLGALIVMQEGRPTFIQVDADGPAAAAGIKEGDHIVRLGGLFVEQIDQLSRYELCRRKAGATIDVEIARSGAADPIKTQLKLPERQYQFAPEQ